MIDSCERVGVVAGKVGGGGFGKVGGVGGVAIRLGSVAGAAVGAVLIACIFIGCIYTSPPSIGFMFSFSLISFTESQPQLRPTEYAV